MLTREQLAQRTALEFSEGDHVYLGTGLPSLCVPLIAPGVHVTQESTALPEQALDVAVVVATQVNLQGELAGEPPTGGGDNGTASILEQVRGAKRVIVMMEHCSKEGMPNIVDTCTLPLTGVRAHRIITDLAVLDVAPEGLVLREVADGMSARDVQEKTGAPLLAASDMGLMKS